MNSVSTDRQAQLEAILFVSNKPVVFKKMAIFLGVSIEEVKQVMKKIADEYEQKKSGIRLQCDDEKAQFVSAAEVSDTVKEFLKNETDRELTRPALETLTIIAYRGPVKRAEIESIRGINCGLILRNLLIRDLVEETLGTSEHENVYRLSFTFMRWLGIKETRELPEYESLNSNEHLAALLKKETQPQNSF